MEHKSRGTLKCDHCREETNHQHWIKPEGLICNDCETDLYRTYCRECENHVEVEHPCEHRLHNAHDGDDCELECA